MKLLIKEEMEKLFVCPSPKADQSLPDFNFSKNFQVVLKFDLIERGRSIDQNLININVKIVFLQNVSFKMLKSILGNQFSVVDMGIIFSNLLPLKCISYC